VVIVLLDGCPDVSQPIGWNHKENLVLHLVFSCSVESKGGKSCSPPLPFSLEPNDD
jgi:hypothetical protein